jgi:hypothetical protein
MDANRYDIRRHELESLNLGLTWYSDDAATTAMNLTGYTAQMRILDHSGGNVLATLTTSSGVTLGGTAGTITVDRTPAQISAWKLNGKGAYDLSVTSSSGIATTILQGSLEISKT